MNLKLFKVLHPSMWEIYLNLLTIMLLTKNAILGKAKLKHWICVSEVLLSHEAGRQFILNFTIK